GATRGYQSDTPSATRPRPSPIWSTDTTATPSRRWPQETAYRDCRCSLTAGHSISAEALLEPAPVGVQDRHRRRRRQVHERHEIGEVAARARARLAGEPGPAGARARPREREDLRRAARVARILGEQRRRRVGLQVEAEVRAVRTEEHGGAVRQAGL